MHSSTIAIGTRRKSTSPPASENGGDLQGDKCHGTGRGFSVTLLRWHPAHLPAPGSETGTPMRFTAFVPLQAAHGALPVVWYLSGLTCTEENFTVKAGAQRIAANSGSCWLRLTQARAGMEDRGTRRAHTTSDWEPAFVSTQRNRHRPGTPG